MAWVLIKALNSPPIDEIVKIDLKKGGVRFGDRKKSLQGLGFGRSPGRVGLLKKQPQTWRRNLDGERGVGDD